MREQEVSELVLDVGNSRMKMALFSGSRIMELAMADSGNVAAVKDFLGDRRPGCCVVGSVARPDDGFLHDLGRLAPVCLITGTSGTPLRNHYATPATLGVDRLANAVAAASIFEGRAVLAIDAGTCITYDLVDAERAYLGGMITPGIRMRGQAMHAYSARLPEVMPGPEPPLPGTDTESSLAAGIHHGAMMEMEGFVRHFRQKHPDLAVVVTGGDAVRAVKALKSNIFAHPTLTLIGLHVIAHHETDPRPAPAR